MTTWSSAGDAAKSKLLDQIAKSLDKQVENAITLSPVSTEATRPGGPHGQLKAGWKLSGGGTRYKISNHVNHTAFQELGTRKQSGREMLGLRSGRIVKDIVNRVRI